MRVPLHPRNAGLIVLSVAVVGALIAGGDVGSGVRSAPGSHLSSFAASGPLWKNLTTAVGPGPGRIGNGGLVYDVLDGYLVFFGGQTSGYGGSKVQSETWTFNGTWHNITTTAGTPPTPRTVSSSMAYDAADGYVLLFSGEDDYGSAVAGTWAFSAGKWTQLHPTVSPPARILASMAFDPGANGVLLFGGSSNNLFSTSSTFYRGTWLFSGGNWSKLNLTKEPAPRRGAQMAFDPAAHATILFGGIDSRGSGLSDTWYFADGSWSQSAVPGPPSRWLGEMNYVPDLRALVLFGGCTAIGCVSTTGGTWVYVAHAWKNGVTLYGLTTVPSARGPVTGAYDRLTRQFIVFGGHLNGTSSSNNPTYYVAETWEFL